MSLDLGRLHFELEALGGLLDSIRLALIVTPIDVIEAETGTDGGPPAPLSHEFLAAYA